MFAMTGADFDTSRLADGAGLINMRDRLGAVGGALRVESDGMVPGPTASCR